MSSRDTFLWKTGRNRKDSKSPQEKTVFPFVHHWRGMTDVAALLSSNMTGKIIETVAMTTENIEDNAMNLPFSRAIFVFT